MMGVGAASITVGNPILFNQSPQGMNPPVPNEQTTPTPVVGGITFNNVADPSGAPYTGVTEITVAIGGDYQLVTGVSPSNTGGSSSISITCSYDEFLTINAETERRETQRKLSGCK